MSHEKWVMKMYEETPVKISEFFKNVIIQKI